MNTDAAKLRSAFGLAHMVHAGQKRVGGEDYIWHPVRVANSVAHLGVAARIVGILHDCVEDDSTGLVTVEKIRDMFGDEVADAVDSVTRREGEVYMDMIRRAVQNPLGRAVKLADNIDNTESLSELPDERRIFQAKRYARARAILEEEPS